MRQTDGLPNQLPEKSHRVKAGVWAQGGQRKKRGRASEGADFNHTYRLFIRTLFLKKGEESKVLK